MNGNNGPAFTIRRATPGDEGIIVAMLHELAAFERLEAGFTLTPIKAAALLFGPEPAAVCELAFRDGEAAGIALWFRTLRSFRAEPGVFIEDLYVRPAFRGQGLGRQLLGHLARQTCRLEWRVLDWNEKALGFYRGLGARPLADWLTYELDGAALERLGA